jgi:hypothetical protein
VLGIFPNEFYLSAAYVAAKVTRNTFIPYYHNTYLENRRGLARVFAAWLQKRTFRAPKVFVMSAGLQEYYASRYSGVEFIPLVHTFVGESTSPSPTGEIGFPVRLAMLGNLNASNRDAMLRFAEMVKSREDCILTFFTGTPTWAFERDGIAGPQFEFAQVGYDSVVEVLRRYDILLLPHGFHGDWSDVEYATIFPTRTVSYLQSAKPILAHSPPNAFLTRWLKENRCALVIDEPDVEKLSAALEQLISDATLRYGLSVDAHRAVQQFRASSVVESLKQHLAVLEMSDMAPANVAIQHNHILSDT